jgi:hypothetical protein
VRIHSAYLSADDMWTAAAVACAGVTRLTEHGSKKRGHAFELQLSGNSPYRQRGGEHFAASWGQWRIALNHLWTRDVEMTCSAYANLQMFNYATGHRFTELTYGQAHRRHRWQNVAPYVAECTGCGAIHRWDWRYAALGQPGPVAEAARLDDVAQADYEVMRAMRAAESEVARQTEAEMLSWWAGQRERALARSAVNA